MEPGTEVKSLEDWCEQQSSKPMFMFWFTVLQLQLTLLVFVHSIRTGNFQLYVQSLTKIVSWFFSLDHYNYAQWISVHLCDTVILPHLHPGTMQSFNYRCIKVKSESYIMLNVLSRSLWQPL